MIENPDSFSTVKVFDLGVCSSVDSREFAVLIAVRAELSASPLPGNCEAMESLMPTSDFYPAKASVLVVEDSPELQNYLRLLLELDRYQVEIAGTGEEALQRVRNGCTPRVVLLDMQMPGMDGLETLRILRQLHPTAKVIMCSAVDDPEKIRQAISLGAQAYLVKPVQHLYLSAAIERCLGPESNPGHESERSRGAASMPQLVYRAN